MNSIIYSFHMPLFFFISALLQRQHEDRTENPYCKEAVINKTVGVIVPYCAFSAVYWTSKVIMASSVNNPVSGLDLILSPIFPLSTLWFINALLCYWLIRSIIFRLEIPNWMVLVICIFVSLASYTLTFGSVLSRTVLPRLMRNSVYYALGIEFYKIEKYLMRKSTILAGLGLLMTGQSISYINVPMVKGLVSLLTACGGILFICGISTCFSGHILEILGRHSMGLYFLHDYVVCFTVIAMKKLVSNDSLLIVTAFMAGVAVSYIVYGMCIRNRLLKNIFQPPKFHSERKSNEY